jgi:Uma2 family endonuclease
MTILVQDLIQNVVAQPQAYLILQQVQAILADEHLKRQHFYDIITEEQKMEFINGEIVYHSPVMKRHLAATQNLMVLLNTFSHIHDLGFIGVEKALISLTRNDYEPDICFFRKEIADNFTQTQSRFPVPNFVAEILSNSTAGRDRGVKFLDYAAHGVEEYWIVDADTERLEQYCLQTDGTYELAMKAATGEVQSRAVAGFTIPVRALFDDDVSFQTLRKMMPQGDY